MQQTEKSRLTFASAQVSDDGSVEFTTDVEGDGEGRSVQCRVGRATLIAASGQSEEESAALDQEDILDLFDIFEDRIHGVVAQKLEQGQIESDGSIVIGDDDLADRRKAQR
jgi:hypothetical protein